MSRGEFQLRMGLTRIGTLVLMLLAFGAACSDSSRARSVSLLAPSQPSREVELEGESRTLCAYDDETPGLVEIRL